MSYRPTPLVAGALLLSALLDARAVGAQCTRPAEAATVGRSASKRARCKDSALRAA